MQLPLLVVTSKFLYQASASPFSLHFDNPSSFSFSQAHNSFFLLSNHRYQRKHLYSSLPTLINDPISLRCSTPPKIANITKMTLSHHSWFSTRSAKCPSSNAIPCVQQTICFYALPAGEMSWIRAGCRGKTDRSKEIRNKIYEYCMPAKAVIETQSKWMDVVPSDIARQPAITQASHQTRKESLLMFYSRSTFYVWIDRFDFEPLIKWIEYATSEPTPPMIKMHIMLMDKMSCYEDLERFAAAWYSLENNRVKVEKVYSSYRKTWLPSNLKLRLRDGQCSAVKSAIEVAGVGKVTKEGIAAVLNELRSEADWEWACGSRCRENKPNALLRVGNCSIAARMCYKREKNGIRTGGPDLRQTVAGNLLQDKSLVWTVYRASLDARRGSRALANPWRRDNDARTQGRQNMFMPWRQV